jgi:tol-pal system protein YbgF
MNRWILLLTAAVLVSGCASRKEIVRFQEDMTTIQNRLVAIQSDQEKIRDQLAQIEKAVASLRSETNRTKADLMSQMAALTDQSRFLQGLLDDTGSRMSKLIRDAEKPSSAPVDSASADTTTEKISPKQLYDSAYLDLSRKHYDLALQGFRAYLARFPKSEYAGNAQYWIGEIAYVQGDYPTAQREFEKVVRDYGGGNKAAASMLKMGFCRAQLKDPAGAREFFRRVVQVFPNTEEARLAKQKLEPGK